jgi:hypothetical protein
MAARPLQGGSQRQVFTQQIGVVRGPKTSFTGDALTQFGQQLGQERKAQEAEDDRRLMRRASTAISNANLEAEKQAPDDPEAYKEIYNSSINGFLKGSGADDTQAEAIIGSATITRNSGETTRLRAIRRDGEAADRLELKTAQLSVQDELEKAIRRNASPDEIAAKRLEWDMVVGGGIASGVITAEESIAMVDAVDKVSVSAHLRAGFDAAVDQQAYMDRIIAAERNNDDTPLSSKEIDAEEKWMQAGIDDTDRREAKAAREAEKAFNEAEQDAFDAADARIIALKDDPANPITEQYIEEMNISDKYKNRLKLNYETRVGKGQRQIDKEIKAANSTATKLQKDNYQIIRGAIFDGVSNEADLRAAKDRGDIDQKQFNDLRDTLKRSDTRADVVTRREEALAAGDTATAQELKFRELELGVHDGLVKRNDTEKAFAAGEITAGQRNRLITKEARRAGGLQAAEARAQQLESALAGEVVMSPGNPDHRKSVNEWYDGAMSKTDALSGEEKIQARGQVITSGVAMAKQIGIVPQGVEDEIVGRLVAATGPDAPPELAAAASALLMELDAAGLASQFNPKAIAMGRTINDLQKVGYSAEDAIATARTALDADDRTIALRKSEYSANDGDAKADKHIIDSSSRIFGADTQVSDLARADYRFLVQTEYNRIGNMDTAIAVAETRFRGLWAETAVGPATRWMKLAPEAVYAVPGQSGEWVREEFNTFVAGTNPDPKFDTTGYSIVADRQTRLRVVTVTDPNSGEVSRFAAPDYAVQFMNEHGVFENVLDGFGQPKRWSPDWESSAANQRIVAKRERDLVEAQQAVKDNLARMAHSLGGNVEQARKILARTSELNRQRKARQDKETQAAADTRKSKEVAMQKAMEASKPILGN